MDEVTFKRLVQQRAKQQIEDEIAKVRAVLAALAAAGAHIDNMSLADLPPMPEVISLDALKEELKDIERKRLDAALRDNPAAELRRILIERARPKPSKAPEPPKAPEPSKAAKNFAVLVEVVEQVCGTRRDEPRNSKPFAIRIKKMVDSMLRARGMEPAGIGRLKRAIGKVQERNQK